MFPPWAEDAALAGLGGFCVMVKLQGLDEFEGRVRRAETFLEELETRVRGTESFSLGLALSV